MNKKLCFYTKSFPRIKNYHDMVDLAVEYGMEAIEGFCSDEFATPDLEAAREMRAYADSKNIKFSCFSVFLNLVGDDSKEQIERLKGYADVAKILGSPYLHHTVINEIYEPANVLPKKEELFNKGIEAVREVYDYAESIGIRTIIEDQGYIYNGVEGFTRFLREVDRNIGVVADFGNIWQREESIVKLIEAIGVDKICHAHVKDVFIAPTPQNGGALKTAYENYMHEALLGEGCAEAEKALKLLKKLGYNGYYSLEYAARTDDSDTVDEALSFMEKHLA